MLRKRKSTRSLASALRGWRTNNGRELRTPQLEQLEARRLLAGPQIADHSPEVLGDAFESINVTFSEAIDASTFEIDDVAISGPGGSIAATNVTKDPDSDTMFQIDFPPLASSGDYQVVIGPQIADQDGNFMEPTAVYTVRLAVLAEETTISEEDRTREGQDILVKNEMVMIDGPHTFNSVHVINGGVLTHTGNTENQTHKLDLTVTEQVIVDATSLIDVSGKGYLPGRTTGNTTEGAATNGAGGSYGGQGAWLSLSNPLYDEYESPSDWGSGGNAAPGGGQVRISADALVLNGSIKANGESSSNGAGSGGAIYVTAKTLQGSGSMTAVGGSTGQTNFDRGAGGGGRIAVRSSDFDDFDLTKITAPGGGGKNPAGPGTVYLRDIDKPTGTLIYNAASGGDRSTPLGLPDDDSITFSDAVVIRGRNTKVHATVSMDLKAPLTVEESATLVAEHGIQAAARMTVRDSGSVLVVSQLHMSSPLSVSSGGNVKVSESLILSTADSLSLAAGGKVESLGMTTASVDLTIAGGQFAGGRIEAPNLSVKDGGLLTTVAATDTEVHKLELDIAGTLSVDAASRIDVSGMGYLGQRTTGNSTEGGASGGSGGSYGGSGSIHVNTPTNATYGDFADPEDWGSGGSDRVFGAGGAGGGLVRITSNEIRLDGLISAVGRGSGSGGSGSGGGIYVETTLINGSGSINASGAARGAPSGTAGGGGGRVAVYAVNFGDFNTDNIKADGGGGAEAGTVHWIEGRAHTHVRSLEPKGLNGGYVNEPLDHVILRTNKPLDLDAFELNEFSIRGPLETITPTNIDSVPGDDRAYRLDFATRTENGIYHFELSSTVLDQEGFALDQNADGKPGTAADAYESTLILDTVPPKITRQSPAGDVSGTIESVDLWFSEAIDERTIQASDFEILDSSDEPLTGLAVQPHGFNRYQLSFPVRADTGLYRVRAGTDIRDLAGNSMESYESTFNVVDVDLKIANVSVDADTLWAGDQMTVSWTGRNDSGAPLVGSWNDAVYLSTDDEWDIGDIRVGIVEYSGGLAQDQTYSQEETFNVPGTLPGMYYVVVRADVYNQEREFVGEGNNGTPSAPLSVDVRTLPTDGTVLDGLLISGDTRDYYALTVNSGEGAEVFLDGLAEQGVNEIFVSRSSIPTQFEYDVAAKTSIGDAQHQDRQLTVTAPLGGATFYVLIYGNQVNNSAPYNLSANAGAFLVDSITPEQAVQKRHTGGAPRRFAPLPQTTITINGAGMTSATNVEFIATDGSIWRPDATRVVSLSELSLDLEINDWPIDIFDVRVTKGGATETIGDAFTIVAGGSSELETNIILPRALDGHMGNTQTVWVEYANVGDAPMAAPLLRLTGNQGALLTADPELARVRFRDHDPIPAGISDSVELLGVGSGSTPGILQPGDSGRVRVFYRGISPPQTTAVTFRLSALTADALSWKDTRCSSSRVERPPNSGRWVIMSSCTTTSEDWTIGWFGPGNTHEGNLKEDLQPEWMPADAWEAVWRNLHVQIGEEWGNYVDTISDNANFVHALGQDITDIDELWKFEVTQAMGIINPLKNLVTSVDASLPTPGLPLVFSRVYGQSIPSRFEVGSLGRGWRHNWEVSIDQLTTGDVVLRGPGGVDRFFTRNADGSYSPQPGDFATLSSIGETFRLTETDQTVWQFRSDQNLDYFEDTNGNRVTLGYTDGNLTNITHSSDAQLLLDYDANGRLWHVTDPAGPEATDDQVTTYRYDTSGYLSTVLEPKNNRSTTYTYETGGSYQQSHALLTARYPDERQDEFVYDTQGRLSEVSRGGTQSVTFTYDSAGGVTVTDASRRQSLLAYGAGGQLEQVRDANGNMVSLDYQDALLTELIGPQGERYSFSYAPLGNLAKVVDAAGEQTTFTHDPAFNQVASVTDPKNHGIDYTYDSSGNLETITYEDDTHEDFTYDADGNVLAWTNRRGQKVTYTYNDDGQLTSKDYPDTPGDLDYVYAYDASGNLTSVTDPNGTTRFDFDPITDELRRIEYPGGEFFTFDYDDVGRRIWREDQDRRKVTYTYDDAGQLDGMSNGDGSLIVDYAYDDTGRLSRKTLGNGVFTTYEYDPAGNLLHLVNLKPDNSVLSRFDYVYDASGRRTSMSTLEGDWHYGYDPIGQLASVERPDGHVVKYIYDAAGNRTEVRENDVSTPYTPNEMNQSVDVGGVAYSYDDDGNMTSKTEGGVRTTYGYDIENRLISVETPTDVWTYAYDAFGNRVTSNHNGQSVHFVVDPTGLGNVAAEYDDAGNVIARYDHGHGLLSRTDTAGQSAFYTFSAIGNTAEITDSSANVLNTGPVRNIVSASGNG